MYILLYTVHSTYQNQIPGRGTIIVCEAHYYYFMDAIFCFINLFNFLSDGSRNVTNSGDIMHYVKIYIILQIGMLDFFPEFCSFYTLISMVFVRVSYIPPIFVIKYYRFIVTVFTKIISYTT